MNFRTYRTGAIAALAAIAVLTSGSALAQTTNSLRVTANITGTCNFNAPDGGVGSENATLDFGALDQTTATDASPAAPASLSFWCTNGTDVTGITPGAGQNAAGCSGTRCLSNGTGGLIPYALSFNYPSGTTGAGKTAPISVQVSGTIANADFVDAPAGAYSDSVQLTIAP